MRAKGVEFDVTYINLRDKPDWFLEISPHGKVPVLNVDGTPLFESNAIAEFLEEVVPPALHPADPIKRARNRAWTDFVREFAADMSKITYCGLEDALPDAVANAQKRVERLEHAIATERGNNGPYFNGPDLCLVDAAYAPFLQRFAMLEPTLQTGLLTPFPLVSAWSDALLSSDVVKGAVAPEFPDEFQANQERRKTVAWQRMQSAAA